MQSEKERDRFNKAYQNFLNFEKAENLLHHPGIKKFHVFSAVDSDTGMPSKEMRRAWRRYNRGQKKLKDRRGR